MEIIILRLGHRKNRDYRLSTHVFLTSRAFGANKGFFSGDSDIGLIKSLEKVKENWGGNFKIEHVKNWKKWLIEKKKTHKIIHLTMYGQKLNKT